MVPLFIAIGISLLVFWYVSFRIRRRRLYELAGKLPGPPQLPLIGHLHRFMGDMEVLTNPVDIEYVLKNCLAKDEWFAKVFRKATGNGMGFAPLSFWHRRRKVAAPAFAMKNLAQLVEVFSEQSQTMVQQLQHQIDATPFDAFPHFTAYSLKSILQVALGIDTKARAVDFAFLLKIMSQMLTILCERIFYPWLYPEFLFRLSPSYQKHRKCLRYAQTFIDDMIRDAKQLIKDKSFLKSISQQNDGEDLTQKKPFLSFLMEPQNKVTGLNDLELREEIILLAVAATDTSGVGTCFTLMLLGQHQDVQDKVYQELVDVFGTSDRPLVKEDLPKLCYLERVIKESLRLYPPAPIISRQSDIEITLPSGNVLPAGCGIPISIWGVHRNPKYWGADAEQFQPDRFSPERYNPEHPCVYMPFSAGPRNCIGLQYAMMSTKTSLATVLRKYRVRVSGSCPPQIRVKFEVMLKPVSGFNIVLERRD